MKVKFILLCLISGTLSLTAFSQSPTATYLTLPLNGELEYTPTTHFVYKTNMSDTAIVVGPGGYETLGSIGGTFTTYTLSLAKGKVGIGIPVPAQKLHVNGTGLFSDKLVVGDSVISSSQFKLKLQLGNLWTFSDLTRAKIMGYNCLFFDQNEQIRRIAERKAASAIMMNQDGSIELFTSQASSRDISPNEQNYFTMLSNGNVGIGTYPQSKLQVSDGAFNLSFGHAEGKDLNWGTAYIGFNATRNNATGKWKLKGDTAHNGGSVMWTTVSGSMYFAPIPSTSGGEQTLTDAQIVNNIKLLLTAEGNVGIGTTNTGGYKLRVHGKINCTEVVVTANAKGEEGGEEEEWPDYVFAEDYNLRSLDEVASYIEKNKRLPEIPSAAEVAENGVNLLEINTLLLKKVEELTLYIIQQQKEIDELKKR